MLSVKYASSTSSGTLANAIGWIDFGPEFNLSNANPTASIRNKIPGGYVISFDINVAVTGNAQSANAVRIVGNTVPTSSQAPFANVSYTGIEGNVALYQATNPPVNNVLDITATLSNIRITDSECNLKYDFIFFVADAETTNQGQNTEAEIWNVTTDGSPWALVQLIPSISGDTTSGPQVSGVNTNQVLEIGVQSTLANTSANVFASGTPSTIVAETRVDGGRQGVSFGVIVLPNQACELNYEAFCNVNWVSTESNYTYCIQVSDEYTFTDILFNEAPYVIGNEPVIIDGLLGYYIFTREKIYLSTHTTLTSPTYDFFVLYAKNTQKTISTPIIFGYSEE